MISSDLMPCSNIKINSSKLLLRIELYILLGLRYFSKSFFFSFSFKVMNNKNWLKKTKFGILRQNLEISLYFYNLKKIGKNGLNTWKRIL